MLNIMANDVLKCHLGPFDMIGQDVNPNSASSQGEFVKIAFAQSHHCRVTYQIVHEIIRNKKGKQEEILQDVSFARYRSK